MGILKHTVSRDDTKFEGWPDIVLTDGGKLICVFTESDAHYPRENSRIAFCESSDRGRSWSRKKYLTGNTRLNEGGSYNCARISKISGGRLAIVCDKGTHDGIEAHEKFRTFIWHGDKEGKDWSEPEQLPNEGIVPDRLLELKSGRWLLGSHKMSGLTGKLEQYVIYSDDKGKTWSDRIIVASDPRYNLCEVSVVELPEDGTLAAFMRENSMLGYDCFKALSHDGGQSWEGVYNMPIPGCHRPAAGFLKDGRILLTYRFVQGGKGRFQNFFAALTDTESILAKERNTQKIRIMPLDYDRSPNPDGGYSGWVQFDDGEIYAVTYIVDDAPKAQIRGYSFYPDEFILA